MKIDFGRQMQQLAMRHATQKALVNVERGRRYTYAEYHRLTNRIANALRCECGIGNGDRFFLILENDNLSLLQFPTFLKQAGTAVMTNLRDAIEEHRWQIAFTKPKLAIIETALVDSHTEMLEGLGCKVVAMDPLSPDQQAEHPNVLCFWDLVTRASDEECGVELDQESHIALMRFTGGTTGKGKCAAYTIDNWLAGRDSCFISPDLDIDRDTRFLHAAPISHGTQIFMYPTFFAGGTQVTINTLDFDLFFSAIATEKITHSFLVPTILYRMEQLQRTNPRDVGSLRTLIYGAAPISAARLRDLLDCFGPIFVQAYAATEAVTMISTLGKADHNADTPEAEARLASAGFITPGIEVRITDESGKDVATGKVGEIRIRSRSVIAGYYDNADGTAHEFEHGYWKSGDLGYLDDGGCLFIVDRLKDMIISGGFNIYAVEVEAALAAHPAVLNSAVIGLPHPEWGEAVHAEVMLRDGFKITDNELIAHVKERLGGYKAPKTIALVDALPLTSVGKVLRRKVREKYV